MTTPPVPPTNEVESLVALAHKGRDALDAELKKVHLSYHVLLVLIAIVAFFVARDFYRAHVQKEAVLETQAVVLNARLEAVEKARDVFRTQALALVNTFKVETVTVQHTITNTRTLTIPFPVTAPDGSVSQVPMQVVAREDFDNLAGSCTRATRDCAAAIAAKDAELAAADTANAALKALNTNTSQRLSSVQHSAIWSKILYGVGGAVVGRASCIK